MDMEKLVKVLWIVAEAKSKLGMLKEINGTVE